MKRLLIFILLVIAALFIVGCGAEENIPNTDNMVVSDSKSNLDQPQNVDYVLVPEQSKLNWEAARIIGNQHTGTVDISEGSLVRELGKYTSGNFVMDMTTITEAKDNEKFLGHVKSDDFFDVENHPASKFIITSIEGKDGDYTVTGDLTILDKTNSITFPATVEFDTLLNVKADFEIDRTKWGVIYDSGNFFVDLGNKAIKDEIKYSLDLKFDWIKPME